MTAPTIAPYAERVAALEAEGLTTSDAQGVADAERRLTPEALEGLRTIRRASRGGFDVYTLAGPDNARLRAQVFGQLTGQRVTVRDAGITALENYLLALAPLCGGCPAVRRDALAAWAYSILNRE